MPSTHQVFDLKVLVLKALSRVFALVHPRVAHAVATPLAAMIWVLSRRRRRVSLINLALCMPEHSEQQRDHIARQAMVHYVRNAMEFGISWNWSRAPMEGLFMEPQGLDLLIEAQAAGKGVVLMVPHHGSWEMNALCLAGKVDVALFKPGKDAAIDDLLAKKRERFGIMMVPANRQGLKELYTALRSGKTIVVLPDQEPVVLPDQEPGQGNGRFAAFFGISALTGVLVPRLVQKTGARVLMTVCLRLPGGCYRLHILPAHEDIYSSDLDRAVAAVNRGVEGCIALDPEQYLWAYKRLRTRPEGEGSIY